MSKVTRIIIFVLYPVLFSSFSSASHANEWLDSLKSLKNEVIKTVPSVSGVFGKNLKCKRTDGFFAETHTLVLNTPIKTLLWETYHDKEFNLPMDIVEDTNQFIEAEVKNIDFFTAASKFEPRIKKVFETMNEALETTYQNKEQRLIAKNLFYNSKTRIILDRTTGKTKFIDDAMQWPSELIRPKEFVGSQKKTKQFLCEKLEKKF